MRYCFATRTALVVLMVVAGSALAHVDTLSQVIEPDPLVRSWEAESLPTLGKTTVIDDAKATGKKALTFQDEGAGVKVALGKLSVGMHCIYLAAKVTEPGAFVTVKGQETKPLYFHLRVNDQADGRTTEHRVRFPYGPEGDYQYMVRIYFHTPEEREYNAEVFLGPRSKIGSVIVDRVEVRNPLAALQFAAVKTKRVLLTDEEIAAMRASAAKEGKLPKPLRAEPLAADERGRRDAVIWNESIMPLNANPGQIYGSFGRDNDLANVILTAEAKKLGKPLGTWKLESNAYDRPWKMVNTALGLEYTMADYNAGKTLPAPWPIAEDKGGAFLEKTSALTANMPADAAAKIPNFANYGFVPFGMQQRYHGVLATLFPAQGQTSAADLPLRYLLLNDTEAAADAAFLLAAFAYRYPAYDYNLLCLDNVARPYRTFTAGTVYGRGCSYQGWSTPEINNLCRAYDKLFPYIAGNQELAARLHRFVPWVNTPKDVIKLIDTFLVQRACQDTVQQVLYSDGMCPAAVVLGPNAVSEKYLDLYFNRIYLRDTLCGFLDSLNGAYSRDGLNYIGSTFYTIGESKGELMDSVDLLRRYVRAGGKARFDISDPQRFPRLSAMADAILRLAVAGGYRAGIGDVGDPQGSPRAVFDKDDGDFLLASWRWTKDKRLAWLLANTIGQREVAEAEWQEITHVANGGRDPALHIPSHVAEGFGLATLEEGVDNPDRRHRNAVLFRFGGIGSGHSHADTLDLEIYAHGLKMSGDLGGRPDPGYGYPKTLVSRVHNVVEVDEASFTGGPMNATGYGWLEAFSPAPGCQFALASGKAEAQPQISRYQRGVLQVLCDAGNGKDVTPSAYLFDVFRTAGGKVHTWCFHGCVSEEFTTNADLKPASSKTALQYLAGYYKDSGQEGKAPAVLEATWKLRRNEGQVDALTLRNAEQAMLEKFYDSKSPEKFTRVSLFGHEGESVLAASWYAKLPTRMFNFPFLHVRREGDATLHSVHTALIEPYAGKPFIASKKALAVQDLVSDVVPGDYVPVALEVKTTFGQTDFLFSAGDRTKTFAVAGGMRASGDLAFVSRDEQGLRLAHLVGGTELETADIAIRIAKPQYQARIAGVDYRAGTLTLDAPLPPIVPEDEILLIGNTRHVATFQARAINGSTVTPLRTALAFQCGVDYVDAKQGYAQLDLQPYLYSYHPDYYEGMTATNEAGAVLGKTALKLGDRFFYTGFPAVDRHRAVIKPEDLTDEDKDGKVTLAMIATEKQRKFGPDGKSIVEVQAGEKMMNMEFTRLRPDGLMFFVKQFPRVYLDALNTPHPGWPYNRQLVRNERGDKEWTVNMPGDAYQLVIDGRKLTDADLPDPNGDGRQMVYLHEYGPGDTVTTPARVALRRVQPGLYELRTNTACTIGLAGTKARLSADNGATWKTLTTTSAAGRLTVKLDDTVLGKGMMLLDVR